MQILIIWLKNTLANKVSQYLGNFLHKKYYLKAYFTIILIKTNCYHIINHLADIYYKLKLLKKAKKLVKKDIEKLKTCGK